MKRFFVTVLFIVLFIVYIGQRYVFSQTITPTPATSSIGPLDFLQDLLKQSQQSLTPVPVNPALAPGATLIPGVNCGNSFGLPPTNSCCAYKPMNNTPKFPKLNIIGIDQAIDVVNIAFDAVIKPIFIPFEEISQKIIQPCLTGTPSTPGDVTNKSCTCNTPTNSPLIALVKLCDGVDAQERGDCLSCINSGNVWTSVKCIYPNVKDFLEKTVFSFGIGLAGTIALLCIIYSAFILQTSRGNPEKIKSAQELLTSCIMGLMLIIFSVFILKFIGADILRIPGFGK